MVQTTSHIFSGKVEVESNLKVGSSHLFVDTENNRVGITTNDPHASLHVNGNAYVGTNFNVGTAIELNQVAGRVKATSFEGDGSLLSGVASTLDDVVNKGNVTSNTVQFTNTDTGIVTTGNVNIGNQLSVGGLTPSKFPYVNSDNTLVDSSISETTDTVVVSSNLEVTGNIVMSGQAYTIESESLKINDRIIGIANNNTLHGADIGMIMNHPTKNVALVHHGASGNPHNHELTIGYTQNTASDTTIVNDTANIITVNVLGHFVTQNNLTVGSGGSYYGDGTTLTGVALFSDMTSNAGRVDALETRATDLELANTVQSGLISGLETSINTKSLDDVVNVSNATSNTVQFTNAGTSLVTSGRLDVGSVISIGSLSGTKIPYADSNKILRDSFISTTNDATIITSNLDVTGNIFMRGERFIVESETKLVNDAIIGIANNNTTSTTDVGILMQRPNANVALIHHGATGGSYDDQFTLGYTQNTLEDSDITNDTANIFTLNVLGNLVTQNNITVGTHGKYYGDGTELTGVALESDLSANVLLIEGLRTDVTSNTLRIVDLENANTVQSDLISDLETDVTSNASRIGNLETSNTHIWSNLESNVIRISALENRATDLELANVVQSSLISDLEASNADIWSNLQSLTFDDVVNVNNATSNTVQFTNTGTSLIASGTVEAAIFKGSGAQLTNIPPSAITGTLSQWSDGANNDVYIASNVGIGNVHTLTSNTLQVGANLYVRDAGANVLTVHGNVVSTGKFLGDGTELTGVALETDLAANVLRISILESANNVQNDLITDLRNDLSSNTSRISILESANNVQNDLITDLRTDLSSNTSRISSLEDANTVQAGLISDLTSDLSSNDGRITNLETDLAPIRTSTTGDIIYASATNTLNRLGIGSSGDVLSVSAGGIPEWSSGGTGGVWSTNAEGEIYFTTSNVGIANADPGHELSVGSNLYVDDDGSNVLVVSGNISADALTLGDVAIVPSYGLDAVTTESNITNQVVQFNHPTTGFVTASNAVVGGTLSIENFEIVQSYGLENVTNVNNSTEDTIISTNVTTGFQSTANISVGRDAIISGNVSIGGIMTMGTVNVVARHSLQGVTDMGNTTTHTIQFTNPTTSLVTSGNVEVGGTIHGYTKVSASGGTESTTNAPGYTTHTFTSDGTFTVTTPGLVEYLVVAGGGGGGARHGGGGGGGGVKTGTLLIPTGTYMITVGDGGDGTPIGGTTRGLQGENSSAFGLIAIGGGGGGGRTEGPGGAGGSGGGGNTGGSGNQPGGSGRTNSSPIGLPQGNDGGTSASSHTADYGGGGGGGAGAPGGNAQLYVPGDGGDGVELNISGSLTYYAGGGGGACYNASSSYGTGGRGGGGNGAIATNYTNTSLRNGYPGTSNTGGGGGGGVNTGGGGKGGSGVVIIRYLS
jgi:uncharacterized coiled-coil protein SlyX